MPKKIAWRRRHAVQIAAQLPDNREDALAILELVKELVEGFLYPEGAHDAAVLPFGGRTKGSSS